MNRLPDPCFRRALACLFLAFSAALPVAAAGDPSPVQFTLVRGIVERAPAGTSNWDFSRANSALKAGDRVRTGPGAVAVLQLPGDCRLFLDAESEVRVEGASAVRARGRINNITLYRGGLFMVVEEVEGSPLRHDVITPEARVSVFQGAALMVRTDVRMRSTAVSAVNGVATVKNLRFREEKELSAPHRLYIDSNKPLSGGVSGEPLDTLELAWIARADSAILPREADRNEKRAQLVRTILSEDQYDKVLVCRFRNESDYQGLWDIERGMAAMAAERLNRAFGKRFETMEGYGTPEELKKVKEGRVLAITARFTDFDFTSVSKGGGQGGLFMQGCRVGLEVTLSNTRDNRAIVRFALADTLLALETETITYSAVKERPFSLSDNVFSLCAAGQAAVAVLDGMEERLRAYLGQ